MTTKPLNFTFVNSDKNICRGAEPSDYSQWSFLRDSKIDTIIKLNPIYESPDDIVSSIYGISCQYYPINIYQQLLPGLLSTDYLRSIIDAIQPNTYIHCTHGQDRTGLICALYQVLVEGKTKEEAEQTMLDNGFHKELIGLWVFWEEFKKGLNLV